MLVFRDLTDYEGFEREQLAAGNVDGKSSWTTLVRGLKEEEREERGKNGGESFSDRWIDLLIDRSVPSVSREDQIARVSTSLVAARCRVVISFREKSRELIKTRRDTRRVGKTGRAVTDEGEGWSNGGSRRKERKTRDG